MKWTMRDFTTKPIAVRVGQKHVREFLQMCEDEGLRWHNCNKPMEFVPSLFGDDLSITANSESAKGKLMCSPAKHYRCCMNMEVVDFEDFAGNHPKYRIVIESDGKDTKAVMEVNGEKVRESEAKLHPNDKFSWRTGAEIAFDRLWVKYDLLAGGCTSDFRVGDRVVCVKHELISNYMVGRHGCVIGMLREEGDVCVEFDESIIDGQDCAGRGKNGHCWYCRPETLIHETTIRRKEAMRDAEDDSD